MRKKTFASFSKENQNILDGYPLSVNIIYPRTLIATTSYMAYIACDDDELIEAPDANQEKIYYCLECFGPVKKRGGGKSSFSAHFYHLRSSPSCRLYSKSEDHMRAQIQLQKSFDPGDLQIERPFIEVNRVADLCWENEKIIFEIQCSPMSEKEAESRMRDYKSCGYGLVWLLDDKRYNKKILRPAEKFLRSHSCYYINIKKGFTSEYYDQMEIFSEGKRIKKGKKRVLNLKKIMKTPSFKELNSLIPAQIQNLFPKSPHYFIGDRIHLALLSRESTKAALALHYWYNLESQLSQKKTRPSIWKRAIHKCICEPFIELLDYLIKRGR